MLEGAIAQLSGNVWVVYYCIRVARAEGHNTGVEFYAHGRLHSRARDGALAVLVVGVRPFSRGCRKGSTTTAIAVNTKRESDILSLACARRAETLQLDVQ